MRRVAITGVGAVTPLGNDMQTTWKGLVEGRSGVDFIRAFDTDDFPVKIAAEVKDFDPALAATPKRARNLDRAVLFGLAAAKEAMEDAGVNGYKPERTGVVLGSCVGGFNQLMQQHDILRERGPDRVSPMFIPNMLVDSPSGQLAIELGIRGPNFAIVSACATGSHAIGEGAEQIRNGHADAVLAGGTEGCIHPLILAGFCSMRGLVQEDEDPATASRPFDATRAGFVMAEGAGVMLLEDMEAAQKRGARIYAEVLGCTSTSDGSHLPAPSTEGQARTVERLLRRCGIKPEQVDYVSAHATSTPLGDLSEIKALKAVFGDHAYKLKVNAPKSMLGHTCWSAPAVETVAALMQMKHGKLHPSINIESMDPAIDLDVCANVAVDHQIEIMLKNSFGFGGLNCCSLFRRFDKASL
jgi:3-oxoacyl-[acyl-carrier-protein] synthase II